ncbi:MAG: HU family DNA-binding protein [Deltaproteobacteria bacterium]|jgi:integration host factor subunit alpha|nr:HU family DNA-binding protein [Deltaproteobacteria bacterium]
MSITKERIAAKIAEELDIQVEVARSHLEALLNVMKEALAANQDVLISGFGKFVVRQKTPRMGRNPKTGVLIDLGYRRVVTFKLSGILRKIMLAKEEKIIETTNLKEEKENDSS